MDTTPPSLDERMRWIWNLELYELMGRLSQSYTRKLGANPADVEDASHDAYLVARRAVEEGRGPVDEPAARPWVCCTLKYGVLNRAKKARRDILKDPDEMPPIPAKIDREVQEELERREKQAALAHRIEEENPEHVRNVMAEQTGPVSERSRKRRQRSKAYLVAQYGVAFAAIAGAVLAFVQFRPQSVGLEPAGTFTMQRAREMRDAALRHCDASEWAACEAELDDAKAIDPYVEQWPAVQRARQYAKQAREKAAPPIPPAGVDVARNRGNGLFMCQTKNWFLCLELLDSARTYDPQGDLAPEITAARRQAAEGIQAMERDLDDAKRGPR